MISMIHLSNQTQYVSLIDRWFTDFGTMVLFSGGHVWASIIKRWQASCVTCFTWTVAVWFQGPGKSQKLAVMFEDWLEAGQRWDRSKLVLQMRQVKTQGRRGSRKWMIRSELVVKYNSEALADEIIACKENLDEAARAACVRSHPDCPSNPDLTQYLVFDAESEYDQSDTVLESLFSVSSTCDRKKGNKRKKGSSSGSSESSSDSSSTSSDRTAAATTRRKRKRRRERNPRKTRKERNPRKEVRRSPKPTKKKPKRSRQRRRPKKRRKMKKRRSKRFAKRPKKPGT